MCPPELTAARCPHVRTRPVLADPRHLSASSSEPPRSRRQPLSTRAARVLAPCCVGFYGEKTARASAGPGTGPGARKPNRPSRVGGAGRWSPLPGLGAGESVLLLQRLEGQRQTSSRSERPCGGPDPGSDLPRGDFGCPGPLPCWWQCAAGAGGAVLTPGPGSSSLPTPPRSVPGPALSETRVQAWGLLPRGCQFQGCCLLKAPPGEPRPAGAPPWPRAGPQGKLPRQHRGWVGGA